ASACGHAVHRLSPVEGRAEAVAGRRLLPCPPRGARVARPRQDRAAEDRAARELHLAGEDECRSRALAFALSGAVREVMTAGSDAAFTRPSMLVRGYPLKIVVLLVLAGAATLPPFAFLAYASLHQLDASGGFGDFTFGHFAAIFAERAFGPTL